MVQEPSRWLLLDAGLGYPVVLYRIRMVGPERFELSTS